MNNFFLVGFMGVGKTTFGKRLAKSLHYKFIDTDSLIEKEMGVSVAEIFKLKGEPFFRELEKKVLREIILDNEHNVVVSTGGGMGASIDNINLMKKKGVVLYLKMNSSSIFNRLKNAKINRPLIDNFNENELKQFLNEKLKEREKYYQLAQVEINALHLKKIKKQEIEFFANNYNQLLTNSATYFYDSGKETFYLCKRMEPPKINIAIDGYSSCGKSTVAKLLANDMAYSYVDTGAMYRAVTLYLLDRGIIKDGKISPRMVIDSLKNIKITFRFNEKTKSSDVYLNGENVEGEIRDPKITSLVSGVSTIREVRQKLIHLQKGIGREKGVVMDGRDIGTAVLPKAELKIFLTSDIEVRTQRRYEELRAKGYKILEKEVKENLLSRDYQDTHREENPLRKAEDAIEIDNSEITLEELLNKIKSEVEKVKKKLILKPQKIN